MRLSLRKLTPLVVPAALWPVFPVQGGIPTLPMLALSTQIYFIRPPVLDPGGTERSQGVGPALQGPGLGWGDEGVLCRWGTM